MRMFFYILIFFFFSFIKPLNAAELITYYDLKQLIEEESGKSYFYVSVTEISQFANQLEEKYGVFISYLVPGNSDLSEISDIPIRGLNVVLPFGIISTMNNTIKPVQLIYLQLMYLDKALGHIPDVHKYQGIEFVIMADSKRLDNVDDRTIALLNVDSTFACREELRTWGNVSRTAFSLSKKDIKTVIDNNNETELVGIAVIASFLGVLKIMSTISCFPGDILRLVSRSTGLSTEPPKFSYVFTPNQISTLIEWENFSVFDTAP